MPLHNYQGVEKDFVFESDDQLIADTHKPQHIVQLPGGGGGGGGGGAPGGPAGGPWGGA